MLRRGAKPIRSQSVVAGVAASIIVLAVCVVAYAMASAMATLNRNTKTLYGDSLSGSVGYGRLLVDVADARTATRALIRSPEQAVRFESEVASARTAVDYEIQMARADDTDRVDVPAIAKIEEAGDTYFDWALGSVAAAVRAGALDTPEQQAAALTSEQELYGRLVVAVSDGLKLKADTGGRLLQQDERSQSRAYTVVALAVAGVAAVLFAAVALFVLRSRTLGSRLSARTAELHGSERRFRALVEQAADLTTVVDTGGAIIYQSPSVQRLLGFAPTALLGRALTELTHPDDVHRVVRFVSDTMDMRGDATSTAVRLRNAEGAWVHVEIGGTDHRDDPAVAGLVLNIRDVSDRVELEERLRFQAFHDPLTGLGNRARFTDRLERSLARRASRSCEVAVLFIDLDDFKSVNDGLGHAAGDALLVEVARRLKQCTRSFDTVARLGGDEFAVLLEEVAGDNDVSDAAAKMFAAFHDSVRIDGRDVSVRASMGIAISTGESDAPALLRNADAAMYAAKSLGKGRSQIYEQTMHTAALDRLELIAGMDGAVERGEFVLEYQPIITLADEAVAGVEALLRWDHPVRGLIQPESFIALAEDTGAITCIGRWVIDEACRQAAEWQASAALPYSFAINVNVSPRQLLHPGFVDDVAAALRQSRIPPHSLVLEITESVMMHNVQASLAVLQQLKALGLRLAIDDFGTGYSSLSYLHQFPFDILKIDRSFVARGQRAADHGVERAIIELGGAFGLQIIAEGIEHADQLARLKSLGCAFGQGYYFSRPLAALAVTDMIAGNRAQQSAA